uniref:B-cell receptor CD22 n=1 Tax=Astatotilapia calliptera TaxID=8154 RepID=A0A3P8PNC7_ASTCA
MSATAAARIEFVFVLLLTASAVLGQNGWSVTYTSTHICALKKSTVDIGCSYSYPSTRHNMNTAVQKRLWFIKNKDEPLDLKTYSRRAEYRFHENDCTLRITDLRERDSDEYKFRFVTNQPDGSYTGSPGVTLTVTDLQVKVRRLLSHTELQCHSSCDVIDPPSYVWYKNGQKIEEETSLRVSVGGDDSSYSCAVKGHEGYRSAAVFSPKLYYVLVNPSAEAEEGTSVSLNCGFNANPAANYSWYKGNIQTRISEGTVLDFSSIQPSDSGEYYCTAENELGRSASQSIFINVKYAPKPVNVSVTPSGEIVEGNSVTLTCSSDANPAAKYTWYKGNNNKPQSVDTQLVFTSIQRSESGQYRCRAYNSVGATSDTISIHVKYPPKFVSVSVSPSNEISEGSSVTLTCSSDAKPTANHFWYKDGDQTPLINERQLSITSIQSFDSGEYVCAAENHLGRTTSESIFIVVIYAPKSLSVLFSPSGEIQEGNSVNLTCSSDANPAANYTWYKENSQTPLVVEPQLSFISIQPTDSGEYYCQAVNKVNTSTPKYISIHVAYAPRPLSMSVSPSGEIVEGNSVTLTCSSDANPAAKYTWYKTNNQTPLIKEPQLIFSSIQSSDSGEYHCTAENKLGVSSPTYNISINVTYAPKLPSVSVSPSAEIVEGSSVTLTCSSDANPAANYTWYKGELFLTWPRVGVHHFTSISSENRGNYSCKSENQYGQINSSRVFINVQYAPKLPFVSVSPSAQIAEGSSVTLTCSSDANPAANYTWYKENKALPLGPEGSHHFTSISSEDRGNYFCKSENQYGQINSSYVFINVQYAPKLPSVSVTPSGEIAEGSSVTLTCSSDANPAANYTWYKEKEDSPKAHGQTFTIDKFSPAHSGAYQCKVQNNRGHHSLTFLLAAVRLSGNGTEMWKIIAGTVIGILLVVILMWILLSIWKKQIPRKLPEPTESPGTSAQKQPVEQKCSLQYASIQFSKKQTDPLYSNINPAQAQKHKKEEEEENKIHYATVKFASSSRAPR